MSKIKDVDRTPVAQDVWCYNPSQKAFTWHVVMNHDKNGYVDRVQCKITGSIRKYKRQNQGSQRPSTPKPAMIRRTADGNVVVGPNANKKTTTRVARSESLEEVWLQGIKAWDKKVVLTYSPAKTFNVGDVLEHPLFGKGVVQSRRENKVEVLFRAELKVLQSF